MSPHATGRRRVHRSSRRACPWPYWPRSWLPPPPRAPRPKRRTTRTATLGDIPLGTFSNALLPGTVGDDRSVDLGGIGSDLYPAGRKGEFWTVTDRGPNGQIKVDGKKRRTFPCRASTRRS